MTTPLSPLTVVDRTAPDIMAAPATRELPAASTAFADLLAGGVAGVESKLASADALVRRFAVGDDVPIHQVTLALEEARLSVELLMTMRARLVEAFQETMRMQL